MLKPILILACLAGPAGLAQAQNATDPSQPQGGPSGMPGGGPEMPQGGGDGGGQTGSEPGQGRMPERHGDMMPGHGGHGMGMMMRHHPDMMSRMGGGAKGFVLDLGDDRSLRVNCGDETMAECLEALRPVIDQMPSLSNDQ